MGKDGYGGAVTARQGGREEWSSTDGTAATRVGGREGERDGPVWESRIPSVFFERLACLLAIGLDRAEVVRFLLQEDASVVPTRSLLLGAT